MTAYVLVDVDVTDPDRYDEYRPLAGAAVEQYGGRYIVRGGMSDVLEGDRVPGRLVVIEFPDADAARRWYDSPEYRHARDVRAGAAVGSFIVVDGV
ncbi:MAG TPA: DUF1330 domain-containing protein [Gaiellaceae bacterium]|nr:DUF1330 domain-containing protein [Gaiellaceae bacterium]